MMDQYPGTAIIPSAGIITARDGIAVSSVLITEKPNGASLLGKLSRHI
jgi:hypothetical protein